MANSPGVYDEDERAYVHGAAVADASTAHALNATFSDTEVEGALNALGTKLNAVLAALRSANIIAED